jgi:hypothetical protein
MPHQCTSCGRVFADGSKEMLSGCPDCGGNKFQYRPQSHVPPEVSETGEATGTSDAPAPTEAGGAADSTAVGGTAETPETSEETPSGDSGIIEGEPDGPGAAEAPSGRPASAASGSAESPDGHPSGTDADAEAGAAGTDTDGDREDRAQADARTGVVSPDELASAASSRSTPPDVSSEEARVVEPSSDDHPSIDELREELNDQFESIRILDQGQYELNLMELYNRDEYIISLQEDGRYVIEVPDTWRDDEDDED